MRLLMRALLPILVFSLLAGLPGCVSTSPADSPPSPGTELDLQAVEQAIHARVNEIRTERDLPPLRWNAELHRLARAHSEDMAARDFFAHRNPEAEDVDARAAERGLTCRRSLPGGQIARGFSENLSRLSHYASYREEYRRSSEGDQRTRRVYDWRSSEEIALQSVRDWMESPGHRENLLNPHLEEHGVGAARSADHQVYITQNLC